MSIRFYQYTNRLLRASNFPTSLQNFTFTACVKLGTAPPGSDFAYISYLQGTGNSSGNSVYIDSSGNFKGNAQNNTADTGTVGTLTSGISTSWFFVAWRGLGTGSAGMKVSIKPIGSGSLVTANLAFNAAVTTVELMSLGTPFADGLYGSRNFNGWLSHVKLFDRALTDAELAVEATQAAPAASNLISYHSFVGTNAATALQPTQGSGAWAPATGGALPVMSDDNPLFTAALSLLLVEVASAGAVQAAATAMGQNATPTVNLPSITAPALVLAATSDSGYGLPAITSVAPYTLLQSKSGSAGLGASSYKVSATGDYDPSFALTSTVFDQLASNIEWPALALALTDLSVAPTITTETLPTVTAGVGQTIPLTVTGTGPFTLSTQSGTPPAGTTYVNTAIVIPSSVTANSYTWTVLATGPTGLTGTKTYTLTVVAATAPTITTTLLPGMQAGVGGTATLNITGTGPFTLSTQSGTPPAGTTYVDTTIVVPSSVTANSYTWTVLATGPTGLTGTRTYTLLVTVPVSAPVITTTALAGGPVNSSYSRTLAATGTTPITWSIISGSLPPGISLDSTTGVISGTPTQTNSYAFSVQASNSAGNSEPVVLTIAIYSEAPAVPQTSGTEAFSPTITEILEEAYERAGAEMRSGYEYRTARRSLNLLTIEWASRGINLWTVEQGNIALVAGTATYLLPVDTIDLLEHTIRQNPGNTSTQTDININRISVSTYATIPNKLAQGRPIQIYINRQTGVMNPSGVVYPTVTVWPVPSDNSYTLVYWRLRRIQDAGTGINIPDIPFRFLPCLVAGLAFYIAMKIPEGQNRLMALQAEYERQWQLASEEDREKASVRFVPRNIR